jgi:hypothetical protein
VRTSVKKLFIVGGQKCGTTTLADMLNQSPEFFLAPGKEPNFFGSDLTRHIPRISKKEYEDLFSRAHRGQIRIDASTLYLISNSAPAEIKAYDSNAKIVIILRDPIEMLYSWHSQMLFTGNENVEDFQKALMLESKRRSGLEMPPGVIIEERLFYTQVGRYFSHVKQYFQDFGSESVKLIVFEDFILDIEKSVQEVAEFAGQNDSFTFSSLHSNPNTVVRSSALRDFRRKYIKSRHLRSRLRSAAPSLMHMLGRGYNLLNTKKQPRPPLKTDVLSYLRQELRDDADQLDKEFDLGIKFKWKILYGE